MFVSTILLLLSNFVTFEVTFIIFHFGNLSSYFFLDE
nr:MAG TPA: hypothetical protein [Caudoviricetes sp.]DAP20621.1 MAG TPA: hypothetical protein [Caudoviricetes sp.]DAP20636.1 MAG TPA: hypothetical protein [Caudoviricetes sp.]